MVVVIRSIHLNITDALLHDLSTFVIDNVHVNVFTLKLDVALSLPTLSLECNYALGSGSVIADLFPLYGAGPARFDCYCNITHRPRHMAVCVSALLTG